MFTWLFILNYIFGAKSVSPVSCRLLRCCKAVLSCWCPNGDKSTNKAVFETNDIVPNTIGHPEPKPFTDMNNVNREDIIRFPTFERNQRSAQTRPQKSSNFLVKSYDAEMDFMTTQIAVLSRIERERKIRKVSTDVISEMVVFAATDLVAGAKPRVGSIEWMIRSGMKPVSLSGKYRVSEIGVSTKEILQENDVMVEL